jgi:hypothetical protein
MAVGVELRQGSVIALSAELGLQSMRNQHGLQHLQAKQHPGAELSFPSVHI